MSLAMDSGLVPGDLRAKLGAISGAGFGLVDLHEPDFVGLDGTADEVGRLAEGLGLKIGAVRAFANFEGLPGAAREQALDRLERKLDLVQALGAKLLLVESSTLPESTGDTRRLVADLAELAARVEKRNLHAAYLALPWGHHVRTDTAALDLVRSIDSPRLGLALNSRFSLADGSKPARLRNFPGDRIFHVQLSDAPSANIGIDHPERQFGLLPSQGELNLAGFVRVIAKNGYRGPWSLSPVGDSAIGGDAATVTRDGYRALVTILDEVARTDPALRFDIPALPERVYASGFEFLEFAADKDSATALTRMLSAMRFRMERRHISKSVELWRQGAVNILINTEEVGFAHDAFLEHGPSVCDMALRVKNAEQTVARASALGAPVFSQPVSSRELDIPAIRGVGGSVVHFIDEQSDLHRLWDIDFHPVAKTRATQPAGLRRIDHVAQTMRYDEMQSWLLYYISTFEMEKLPMVDVADPYGVVRSQAIASPEGEIRLNLNGAASPETFAGSFLADRVGAGVQHIAILSGDIFETSDGLDAAGFERLPMPSNYYGDLQATFALSDDLVKRMEAANILYDRIGDGEYFQLYSAPIFDGFFFEIVERRNGYAGYGARNAPFRLAALTNFQSRRGRNKTAPSSGEAKR